MAAWREAREAMGGVQEPEEPKLYFWRGILFVVVTLLTIALLAVVTVYVITSTDWGRERVRRVAVNWLNSNVHGRASIGRISGNLLIGMTLHDVAITDSAGNPFAAAESFRGDYRLLSLWRKHIWIDNAVVVRPIVILDRPPDGKWNWQHLFPRDTTPKPPSQQTAWGDWLRFTNGTVVGGRLIVRTPWNPSEGLKTQAARDSAIRSVLSTHSRLYVTRVPGGFQKTVEVDSLNASVPLLRLSEPGFKNRLLQVSALTARAFPFRPPAALIRDMKGVFPFNNDSVWWENAYAAGPNSKTMSDGAYLFGSGDMHLDIRAGPASFADMRWVYPRLPEGRGKFRLRFYWKGPVQDYAFSDGNVTMEGARVLGAVGVTLADTLTIHNTDVRVSGLSTRSLEQLIPHLTLPRSGVLSGRATAAGGRHALAVNGDVTFDDRSAGRSRATIVGEVGFPDAGGMSARGLRLRLLPFQVAMLRTWRPSLPVGGVVLGTATVNGSTNSRLALALDVTHADGGERSAITGTAALRLSGGEFYDVDVFAHPVSLVEVGKFLPSAGLYNSVRGPIRINGPPSNLYVNTHLLLPDSARVIVEGILDLASTEKGYDVAAGLWGFNFATVSTKGPNTSLTAIASAQGTGIDLATMRSTFAADVSPSRWDTLAVDSASGKVTIALGLATVPRLFVHARHATATASGAFGLVRGKSGELSYKVATDSLGAFNAWLAKRPGSETPIAPRPGVIARAYRRARADSARIDRETELKRLLQGQPPPKLVVVLPEPVAADTIAGSAHAEGTLKGNIYGFDLRGGAGGENIVFRGNFVRAFQGDYVWRGVRTDRTTFNVGVRADSVSAMGFAFDSVSGRLTYADSKGHAEAALHQEGNREYSASGDYTVHKDSKELRLADMALRFDTATWRMPRESRFEWGKTGVRVSNFELRNGAKGRVYVNGLIPTSGNGADLRFDVDDFAVANIADITQTDIDATGIINLHGTMGGTLAQPTFNGSYAVTFATYNNIAVPDLRGRFSYANQMLTSQAEALRTNGKTLATVDARLPLNLAFTGVTGPRLLPKPMSVDVTADSLPVELIPQFTSIVSNVHGHASGQVSMRGTLKRPSLAGTLSFVNGTFKLNPTGATFTRVNLAARMANDTVYVDSLVGWSRAPVRVRGTLAIGTWRDPSMNLFLVSNGAELFNTQSLAKLRVDAGLALSGPFSSPYLSGAITAEQGVVYAPESSARRVVGAGDPALYNVLDTLLMADRELFPPVSPFLQNLRADVSIAVKHNVWVRNREANIEIYTDDPLTIHYEDQAMSITGVISSERGEYHFLGKRFSVKRGSAMFIGTPDINPTLQLTGEYQVSVLTRGALNIRVLIGGTLRKPTLSLESDAQPPKTQSELLSLLAFGQSTTSLLATGSSSIAGSAATLDLFGVGAQAAVRRLAATALGVAVEQIQLEVGRGLGTDMFDITPADVPQATSQGLGNFFMQTKFEAGKYVTPRTFVTGQFQAKNFGAGIDHRTANGWRFNATFEPRIILLEPTLKEIPLRTVRTVGGFVIREWRF